MASRRASRNRARRNACGLRLRAATLWRRRSNHRAASRRLRAAAQVVRPRRSTWQGRRTRHSRLRSRSRSPKRARTPDDRRREHGPRRRWQCSSGWPLALSRRAPHRPRSHAGPARGRHTTARDRSPATRRARTVRHACGRSRETPPSLRRASLQRRRCAVRNEPSRPPAAQRAAAARRRTATSRGHGAWFAWLAAR